MVLLIIGISITAVGLIAFLFNLAQRSSLADITYTGHNASIWSEYAGTISRSNLLNIVLSFLALCGGAALLIYYFFFYTPV